jgi:short-subunit dehydrogenase
MTKTKNQIILLTGGSAGIGKSAAILLSGKGNVVFSASRHISNNLISENNSGKIIPVSMDVNSESQTAAIVERIVAEYGRLDAVICNAGNGIAGSVEDTSDSEARYQFETNFFGVCKTIRACLPQFRKQHHGKIIVTSSVAGIVPIPFQAYYSAVKSALLTFVQALSMEVKIFGIQCCVILPGDTKTNFTSTRKFTETSVAETSVYLAKMKASVAKMERDEQNGMSPQSVAKHIVKQIYKQKMNPIVVPGLQYKLIYWIYYLIPVRLRLLIVGLLY